jgi:hypothetical protein
MVWPGCILVFCLRRTAIADLTTLVYILFSLNWVFLSPNTNKFSEHGMN